MKTLTTTLSNLFVLLLLASSLLGCGDTMVDPVDPCVENPASCISVPSISLSSIGVTLIDGSDGLTFFARADQDLHYKKVTISPPAPFDKFTNNLGNEFFVEGQSIALQSGNTAYVRVDGEWVFTFDVTTGTGANAMDHTIKIEYGLAGKSGRAFGPDVSLQQSL